MIDTYLLFLVCLVKAHAVVLPPRGVVPRASDPQDQQGGVPAEERCQLPLRGEKPTKHARSAVYKKTRGKSGWTAYGTHLRLTQQRRRRLRQEKDVPAKGDRKPPRLPTCSRGRRQDDRQPPGEKGETQAAD